MVQKKSTTNLTELLLECVAQKLKHAGKAEQGNLKTYPSGWNFPSPDSYVRLVATYLMEYAEDWSDSRAYFSAESIRDAFSSAA